jgi:uncharacterized alkaline shock family protein YloU
MSLVFSGPNGTVTIPGAVLVSIAVRAAESVEGVKVRRKRSVEVESRVVRLELTAPRSAPLVPLGESVQDAVASALQTMCGLDATVDLTFEDVE